MSKRMNEIHFTDIVSKPVAESYELVQMLGIYCWPSDEKERNAGFFLPRLSYNQNKEYLTALYPELKKNTNLQGRGIYTSIWRIANYYNGISLENAERVLCRDIATLSAFKIWVAEYCNNSADPIHMYVLEEEKRFAQFKYTTTQNPAGTIYYDWKAILKKKSNQREKIIGKQITGWRNANK